MAWYGVYLCEITEALSHDIVRIVIERWRHVSSVSASARSYVLHTTHTQTHLTGTSDSILFHFGRICKCENRHITLRTVSSLWAVDFIFMLLLHISIDFISSTLCLCLRVSELCSLYFLFHSTFAYLTVQIRSQFVLWSFRLSPRLMDLHEISPCHKYRVLMARAQYNYDFL